MLLFPLFLSIDPFMSDNYSFLAVAGNMNKCPYFYYILFLFKAFNLYFNGIRDLFLIIYKNFFTYYL